MNKISSNPLYFSKNDNFKIIQFTDLHLGKNNTSIKDTNDIILQDTVKLIGDEKPQFIVFTGDIVDGDFWSQPKEALRKYLSEIDSLQIPWAMIFGNHEQEGADSKNDFVDLLSTFSFCLTKEGPKSIHGVGNFIIPIYDPTTNKPLFNLYFFDSGSADKKYEYDWIRDDQVDWFRRMNKKVRNIPAYVFMHTPPPEILQSKGEGIYQGEGLEVPGPTKHKSKLFAAFTEDKNILAIFFGHDHYNNYCTKLQNIHLCYGQNTGFNFYTPELKGKRGARLIRVLKKSLWDVKTDVVFFSDKVF